MGKETKRIFADVAQSVEHLPSKQNVTGSFPVVRSIFAAPSRFPDKTTNPRYWNSWEFEWNGGAVRVFHQRWCRGKLRGRTSYIRVTKNHERLLVRDLRKLDDWLTDTVGGSFNRCQLTA